MAQSLFHDHVTAKALGMTTVWIDRRAGRTGHGATPPAEAAPDATFPDMRSLRYSSTTINRMISATPMPAATMLTGRWPRQNSGLARDAS